MNELYGYIITAITLGVVIYLDKTKSTSIQTLLKWFPAILFAYVVPAIITHSFALDLSLVSLHQVSRDFIMPLAIVAVMSALSFTQLKAVGIRPIMVFVAGSAAVALLPIILIPLFSAISPAFHESIIVQEYWLGLVTMVGSWIGGSTSQLILKEIVQCPEGIFLIILVMDNVLVNLWTIFMFQQIKRSDRLNARFHITDPPPKAIDVSNLPNQTSPLATGVICLASVIICQWLFNSFLLNIVVLSILGLIYGNFVKLWDHALVLRAGGFLIITIMAILGLKLNFHNFGVPLTVVAFSLIWIVLHYAVMLLVARKLKVNMAWVPISSMANVGGISTAPAVTKAYSEDLMPHAILLAILSMVSGTYWGMITIYLIQQFIL